MDAILLVPELGAYYGPSTQNNVVKAEPLPKQLVTPLASSEKLIATDQNLCRSIFDYSGIMIPFSERVSSDDLIGKFDAAGVTKQFDFVDSKIAGSHPADRLILQPIFSWSRARL